MNLANLIKVEHLDRVLEMIGDPAHVSLLFPDFKPLVLDNSAGDKFIALVENLPVSISCCPQAEHRALFGSGRAVAAPCRTALWICFGQCHSTGGRLRAGSLLLPIFIRTVLPGGVSRKVFDGLPLRHSSVVFIICPAAVLQGIG